MSALLMLFEDGFSPRSLFAAGEQGAWYDPSDFSTLYQDAAGTTPVTALGQSVGLMLDKSGRGNHAYQTTAASRPTVEARVNLLTKSEVFSDSQWVKDRTTVTQGAIAGPLGGLADKISEDTSTNIHYIGQLQSCPVGAAYTASIYLKAAGRTNAVWYITDNITGATEARINLTTGTATSSSSGSWTNVSASIVDVGAGWYRVVVSGVRGAGTANSSILLLIDNVGNASYVGDGVSGMYATAAQLEYGPTATTYQRVNTATDYVDVGAPRYLSFDGVDDGLVTNSIDFTGTDKMTVWAGVRKESDAAAGMVAELSATIGSNNGAFSFFAPVSAAANVQYGSKGTTASFATPSGLTSPVTLVMCGQSDIAGPSVSARINGVVAASSASSQGTGNYGNYPLYIGRRGGTSLPFNGRLYGLIIRGAASNAGQIAAAEAYMNSKTGAY